MAVVGGLRLSQAIRSLASRRSSACGFRQILVIRVSLIYVIIVTLSHNPFKSKYYDIWINMLHILQFRKSQTSAY